MTVTKSEPEKSVVDLETLFVLRGYADQLRFYLQPEGSEDFMVHVADRVARMHQIISARAAQ